MADEVAQLQRVILPLLDVIRLQNRIIEMHLPDGSSLPVLNEIVKAVAALKANFNERMDALDQSTQELQDAISLLNQETDNLAARLVAWQSKLEAGVTPEDAKVIAGQLGVVAGRLRQLAATSDVVPGGVVAPDQPLNIEVAA